MEGDDIDPLGARMGTELRGHVKNHLHSERKFPLRGEGSTFNPLKMQAFFMSEFYRFKITNK